MSQNPADLPIAEPVESETIIGKLLSKLPPKMAAFWLRFVGIFTSRRMSSMAAVSAFWALFSMPWILIVFIFTSTFVARLAGENTVKLVEESMFLMANQFLTPQAAQSFVIPTLNSIFSMSFSGLGLVGFFIAIWSGSKAVMALMDAISFIEDTGAPANFATRRLVAVGVMLIAIIGLAIDAPVIIVGPKKLGEYFNLPTSVVWIVVIGMVLLVGFAFLVLLYKVSTRHFKHWDKTIPGAAWAMIISILGVIGLSIYVRRMFDSSPFLGSLLTPIALMIAAYVFCLIVLAGAVYNYVKSMGANADDTLPGPIAASLAKVEAKSGGKVADQAPAGVGANAGTGSTAGPGS